MILPGSLPRDTCSENQIHSPGQTGCNVQKTEKITKSNVDPRHPTTTAIVKGILLRRVATASTNGKTAYFRMLFLDICREMENQTDRP